MPVSAAYLEYVLDQLSSLRSVTHRRMFGGIGLYCEHFFFGLIDDDVVYLKVDDENRPDYVRRGCEPFRPFADKPEYSMSYYRLPEDVLEDRDELAKWARSALEVARRAAVKKPRKVQLTPKQKSARKVNRKRVP